MVGSQTTRIDLLECRIDNLPFGACARYSLHQIADTVAQVATWYKCVAIVTRRL